ncbi:MAG: aspartate carbamoyltransferase [Candidatus Diapherotrites archaeon]|nr:aspartate carbamoyltransferase [Candidatus Diapherotrites archaeon]
MFKHVISIKDFSHKDIDLVLGQADKMLKILNTKGSSDMLHGKVLASLFFEPSTRTRLSFEAAMHRLGGSVIGFSDPKGTSLKKKETTADTIRTVAAYSDIIAMRHPMDGAAKLASDVSTVPIINGGDGSHQHPTQTLLDLFTIKKELGTLNDLKIAIVGDLRYGRTVHSLVGALKQYKADFRFIAPELLKMPEEYKKGLKYDEFTELDVGDADVVYMTRIQAERFSDATDYEKVRGSYVITPKTLSTMKKKSIVMHPLPRVDEISWECDADPRCVYFNQAFYGVPTRMALIAMLLGVAK